VVGPSRGVALSPSQRGLTVTVAGPDGAGKTTFCNALTTGVLAGRDVRRIHHRFGVLPVRGGSTGANKAKLGAASRVTFRVIDNATIERIADTSNYILRMTVRVKDKSCSAKVQRELKPGQKVFRVWDEGLKRQVDYRSVETSWATCAIE